MIQQPSPGGEGEPAPRARRERDSVRQVPGVLDELRAEAQLEELGLFGQVAVPDHDDTGEKKRYIQKTEKAKSIFPRSCRRGFVISCCQPGERRSSTQMSDVAATPERKPPHVKYQPKMFENQVGVRDIT